MMRESLRAWTPNPLKIRLRLLRDPEFRRQQREITRIRALPRYRPGETTLLGQPMRFVDGASFFWAYRQIFEHEIYGFDSPHPDPVILDCGANIGLAVWYWKRRYPQARITAFEPDPAIFETLSGNCAAWPDVKLINRAVWTSEGELPFWPEGADGGRVITEPGSGVKQVMVPATRLRDYLAAPVDLLKIDIEGAEIDVLLDCAGALDQVQHLFVEYHSLIGQPQRLDSLLQVLLAAGLRVHIQPELVSPRPFLVPVNDSGMDQRLNIFAYRRFLTP
jgi:FkbM family methyltransferase